MGGTKSPGEQRFMAAYSSLARLPPPELREGEIGPLVLENRSAVRGARASLRLPVGSA